MIFSNRVMASPNHQRAVRAGLLCTQTAAEIIDDLIVERLALRSPALGAHELLHALAQSSKAQQQRRSVQFAPERVTQARKENQLAAQARFAGQLLEVRFDNPGRWH